MKSVQLVIILFVLLTQCIPGPEYKKQDLKGGWDCYKLERDKEVEMLNPGDIGFIFEENTYKYKGFSFREEGTWSVDGRLLETTAKGALQKEVEIEHLSGDTLILYMVDNGVPMKMYLKKASDPK